MNIEYWTEWHANNNFLEIGICYMLYNVVYNKKKIKRKNTWIYNTYNRYKYYTYI